MDGYFYEDSLRHHSMNAMVGRARSQFLMKGNLGVSQNYGYLFGSPHNKDYSILGSILGFPYFGKLPFRVEGFRVNLHST